jgi:hypothetical protein
VFSTAKCYALCQLVSLLLLGVWKYQRIRSLMWEENTDGSSLRRADLNPNSFAQRLTRVLDIWDRVCRLVSWVSGSCHCGSFSILSISCFIQLHQSLDPVQVRRVPVGGQGAFQFLDLGFDPRSRLRSRRGGTPPLAFRQGYLCRLWPLSCYFYL